MKPYYERGGITIYHADNRRVDIADGSIDLVFTSPPYNIGISPGGNGRGFYTPSRGGRSMTKWSGFDGYGATHDDAMPMEQYVRWQEAFLHNTWRLVAETGAIFYNHKPRIVFKKLWTPLELNPGLPLHQIIVWDRGGGIAMGDSHFCPSHEWILVFSKPGFKLANRAKSALGDVWRIPGEYEKNGHPAPFPVCLPATAIEATGAHMILDPYCGSGSTLVAAAMLGKRAIGIDVSEEYCEIAATRLDQIPMPLAAPESERQAALWEAE